MSDKEYNIKIKIDGADKATKDINKVSDSSKKLANDFSQSINNAGKTVGAFSTSFVASFGAIAASIGVAYTAMNFITDSLKAAGAEEVAINKLNNTLKLTGDYTKETSERFQQLADTIEKQAGFDGELILTQIALAKQLGYSNDQVEYLTIAASKLAVTMNQDVDTSMKQLLASLTGTKGQLAKVNPELKNMSIEAMKAGGFIKYFYENGLQLNNGLNTTEGKLKQAKIAWDDVHKSFGRILIQNPDFQKALISISTAIGNIAKSIEEKKGVFYSLSQVLSDIITVSAQFLNRMADNSPPAVKKIKSEIDDLQNKIDDFRQQNEINGDYGVSAALGISEEQHKKNLARLDELQKKLIGIQPPTTEVKLQKNANVSFKGGEDTNAISAQEQELNLLRSAQAQYETIAKERVALENQTNAEILASKYNFFAMADEATRANRELFTEDEANQFAAMTETYGQQDALRLMQLQQKIATEQDAEKQITLAKQLEVEARMAEAKKEADHEKRMSDLKLQTANMAITTGLAFAKKGSREHKNLLRAQTIMNTAAAVQKTLAEPLLPFPFNIAQAAFITAQGIANLRNIDQQQFANGGIFNAGGTSISGDNVNARLNDREMILNMQQQRNVFDAINSGNLGSGLAISALVDIKNAIINNPTTFNIDGQKLNNKLKDIDNRRLE